jgi:TolB-like protein
MSLETAGNDSAALGIYINYTDISGLSPYRRLIEGRYRQLTQDIIHRQFRTLLLKEESLGPGRLGTKTLAVFPLLYQGTDTKFDALGKGLSEMMIIDLGQVRSLQLVERVRIEALLDELNLGQSRYVDQSTAPRVGKLLSAGRIVNGSFNVSADNRLRLDVASWDIPRKKFPNPVTQSDDLENLFKLEKDLVFSIIKEMGIQLTPAEREKIQFIPTRNITAFLAYSIGLKEEDRGDFKAAGVYYKQAVSLDPGFALAKSKADAADALAAAGGDRLNALAAVEAIDGPAGGGKGPTRDLIMLRLENLSGSIGSGFQGGEDGRKPAEEAARAGAPVGRLPEPPRPPQR